MWQWRWRRRKDILLAERNVRSPFLVRVEREGRFCNGLALRVAKLHRTCGYFGLLVRSWFSSICSSFTLAISLAIPCETSFGIAPSAVSFKTFAANASISTLFMRASYRVCCARREAPDLRILPAAHAGASEVRRGDGEGTA